MTIHKTAEMVLEKGRVPKGVAISAFNNTKLLWLLSGQSCQDCASSLAVPDKEYISCNMTFRVIALNSLLGPEQRFFVQEKDLSSCTDRSKNVAKSSSGSTTRVKFTEESTLTKVANIESTNSKHEETDASKVIQNPDQESVLSFYSAQSLVSPKKPVELVTSSSNEDYYSIEPTSSAKDSILHTNSDKTDKKVFDVEKCISEMAKRHTSELNEIKTELQEIKRLLSSISAKPTITLKSAPTATQILCHIQELQQNMHTVENKVDNLSMEINSKMKHQDRKLSDIRKELNSLIPNHS